MASLANQTISSTYDGLIKTSTDQPVGVSGVQLLEDGVGNTLALSVGRANQGVTVTGTLTATTLTGTVSATSVLADGVTATTQSSGDNSTKVATTAYVDAQVTASDLDFAGDAGTGAVDLDSETFTIAGTANEIETSASGQTITIGLPSSVTVGTLTTTADATINGLTVGRGGGSVSSNVAFGLDALQNNTSGSDNIAIGRNSLLNNSTGEENVAIGRNALVANTSGIKNICVGYTAGSDITTGSNNTIIGDISGTSTLSDTVIIAAGSTERLRIDSSGNVGINTSSPSDRLSVYTTTDYGNNSNYANATIGLGNAAYPVSIRSYRYGGSYLNGLDFYYNNGTPQLGMRINSVGNVGIGTSSPTAPLTVNGVISVKSSDVSTFQMGEIGGTFRFQNQSGNTLPLTFWVGDIERMRIDSDGKVGIGMTPTYRLDVLTNGAASANTVARFGTFGNGGSGRGAKIVIAASGAQSSVDVAEIVGYQNANSSVADNAALAFNVANTSGTLTERMRITSGGAVLVGKTSSSVSGIGHWFDVNGASFYTIANTTNTNHVYDNTNSVYRFYVNGAGTVFATNTTISAISDARLKENIQDLTGGLEAVLSLKPRTYDWKEDSGQTGTGVKGFIAQEVEEVFPEYVDEYLTNEVPEDGIPYKSVRQDFIPILVKAIQEQQEIINDLKARIETLENN
jgi:hypothetical protein